MSRQVGAPGPAEDLPRGRGAPALGAVRTAVRTDVAAMLTARLAGEPGGPAGGQEPATTDDTLPLVLVALSGGADSLALAAATGAEAAASRRRRRRGGLGPGSGPSPRRPPPFRAGAVVVDHRWSPGSAGVAAAAGHAARRLGLDPVEVVEVVETRAAGRRPGAAPGRRPRSEAHARALRYAVLEEARSRHGGVAVLLGHTADDQAEQVLLGLARGSGARSLAGMPAVRAALRRPLLALSRATTTQACREGGLHPWSDPSNADPAHARARVRHRVLPLLEDELGPGISTALVRSAQLLREDADALDALAAELADRAVTVRGGADGQSGADDESISGDGGDGDRGGTGDAAARRPREVTVATAPLGSALPALRTRVLRSAALAAGAPASALTRAHVLALSGLLDPHGSPGPVHLPGMVAAERGCGTLRLWTRATQAPTSPRSS